MGDPLGFTTACYRELGTEMRRLREAAGADGTADRAQDRLGSERISRVESGPVHLDVSELTWYLGIMRVPKEVALPLIDLCRNAHADRGCWSSTYDEWGSDSPSAFTFDG